MPVPEGTARGMKKGTHTTMRTRYSWQHPLALVFISCLSMCMLSCNEENGALAPYIGPPAMSSLAVEEGTYRPKIAWVGGYVAAVGVNHDTLAALDSTLNWLIQSAGDDIGFPLLFNVPPSGTQDVTDQYGGHHVDSLSEDQTYTFWVMKKAGWDQVKNLNGKLLLPDSTLTGPVAIRGDTIFVGPTGGIIQKKRLDVYINIRNIKVYGPLVLDPNTFQPYMTVTPTNRDNNPIVTFQIKQPGVTDTMVAAFGLNDGSAYDVGTVLWEVLTVDTVDTVIQYRSLNIIPSPIVFGERPPRTQAFTEYPAGGLQRNKTYFFWLATSQWDGISHVRSSRYHSYVVFDTW